MAKRKLVEINPLKHRRIEALRKECKAANKLVPTVPYIVDLALEIGLPGALAKFQPTED